MKLNTIVGQAETKQNIVVLIPWINSKMKTLSHQENKQSNIHRIIAFLIPSLKRNFESNKDEQFFFS